MDQGVVIALITAVGGVFAAAGGVVGAWLTHRVSRRREAAEIAAIRSQIETAGVDIAAKMRLLYDDIINDLNDQVKRAGQEATACREAARVAQQRATEAEQMAWQAEASADQMRRLLHHLRPILEHLPDAIPWLPLIDRLVGAAGRTT